MFEHKATKKELMQLRVEQSRALDLHNGRVHQEFAELKDELINQINSEVTSLRADNCVLRTELTTLKTGMQPKVTDNMPEIVSHEDYYRMTFRDEEGNIKTQVEVTPDRVIATANKITLNGADVSNTQI